MQQWLPESRPSNYPLNRQDIENRVTGIRLIYVDMFSTKFFCQTCARQYNTLCVRSWMALCLQRLLSWIAVATSKGQRNKKIYQHHVDSGKVCQLCHSSFSSDGPLEPCTYNRLEMHTFLIFGTAHTLVYTYLNYQHCMYRNMSACWLH